MAYMSQEQKKQLAPAINAVLKKYGMKGTLSIRHNSTLVCTIRRGKMDMAQVKHYEINTYWIDKHYTGEVRKFVKELKAVMMTGNHDRSDLMTDYFNVGWYIDIHIGTWDKAYQQLV